MTRLGQIVAEAIRRRHADPSRSYGDYLKEVSDEFDSYWEGVINWTGDRGDPGLGTMDETSQDASLADLVLSEDDDDMAVLNLGIGEAVIADRIRLQMTGAYPEDTSSGMRREQWRYDPSFRVYVAGSSRELARVRGVMDALREALHPDVIAHDWTQSVEAAQHQGLTDASLGADARVERAQDDWYAIRHAAVFWLLATPRGAGSVGSWCELGLALGAASPGVSGPVVIVSGTQCRETVFSSLADELHEDDTDAMLTALCVAEEYAKLEASAEELRSGCKSCRGTGEVDWQHPTKPAGVVIGKGPCPDCSGQEESA